MVQVYQMTRKADPSVTWWMLAAIIICTIVGVFLGIFTNTGLIGLIGWIVVGVLGGILLATIILGRKAEAAAYRQIEGQPGAVGAVLRTALKGLWHGSEMPIAVNPRTRDAVYRAIGRPGVVLIAEGPATHTKKLVHDEQTKIRRVAPNVSVTVLHVGPDANAVPLRSLSKAIRKTKSDSPALNRAEITAVEHRLTTLDNPVGMPKGVDPTNTRPNHKAARGR